MTSLITAGVDGMFTNFPARLNGVLGQAPVPRQAAGDARRPGVGAPAARRARKRARA